MSGKGKHQAHKIPITHSEYSEQCTRTESKTGFGRRLFDLRYGRWQRFDKLHAAYPTCRKHAPDRQFAFWLSFIY